jgi:arylsulfatase A-like enzyme
MSAPSRPPVNVLWLFCEDVCPWMPLFGDATVATPNLARLAARGSVFTRCFAPAGVCSPSRSGVITGCMPTRIGVHQHVSSRTWVGEPAIHLPAPVRPLPQLFRDAGYYTYNLGKDDYNFAYRREDLYDGPYEVVQFYGPQHAGHGKQDPHASLPLWRNRSPGQPFFGQVTLWGGKNERPTRRPPVRPEDVRVPPMYPDTPVFRELVAKHYNQIQTTDEEVGEILDALERDGLLEDTAILFFADHGYELLRHKQFLYDGGIHVPLIVAPPPRLGRAAGVSDGLVSSIDVAATSLALAGLPVPEWMQSRDILAPGFHREAVFAARDRCDFTIDRIRAVRTTRHKYIRNLLTDRPLMQPQYRDFDPQFRDYMDAYRSGRMTPAQAAFAGPHRPAEELYDLASDPHEMHNLAADLAQAGTLAALRRMLDAWMQTDCRDADAPEPEQQMRVLLERWGNRCVNPEYDRFRS